MVSTQYITTPYHACYAYGEKMTLNTKLRLPFIVSLCISMSPHYSHTKLIVLENKEQHQALIKEKKPMLFQFATDDCPACQQVKKPLEHVAQEKEFDAIVFARINAKTLKSIADLYHIKSIPTFVYLNNGKIIDTVVGMKNANNIKEILRADIRKNLMPNKKLNTTTEPETKKPSTIKQENKDYARELSEQVAQLSVKNVQQKQEKTNEQKVKETAKPTPNPNTQNSFFDSLKNVFSSIITTITLFIEKIGQNIKNLFS